MNKLNFDRMSTSITQEQKDSLVKVLGLAFSLVGKSILESKGFICDYKINGERIEDIEKLCQMDISDRIALAVTEERYEDAARLKKLLTQKLSDV